VRYVAEKASSGSKEWVLRGDFRRRVVDREVEIKTRLTVVAAAALGGSSVIHYEVRMGSMQI
jgi:hypothetical protein